MPCSLIRWLLASVLVFCGWLPDAAVASESLDELVQLDYQIEPGLSTCPDVETFKSLVEHRASKNLARPDLQLDVEIRVRRQGEGLTGSILWRQSGETSQAPRILRSPNQDCARLAATLAFVLAVQMEVMGSEAKEKAALNDRKEAPGPSHEGSPSGGSVEVLPRPLTFAVGLGPAIGVGLAPRVSAHGRVFASLQLRSLSAEIGFEGRPPVTTVVADGAGFRHSLLLGTIAGCWNASDFSACGLTKVGAFQVTGEGVDQPASPVALVVQVGPRFGYLFRFGDRFGIYGHADGGYLLSPWTVRLDGTTVWTMPRLSAVAGIDFVVHFP